MASWSIVIPTYHEAANLGELIPSIWKVVHKAQADTEIIIVDDDSQDGTEGIVDGLIQQGYPVRLLVRRGIRGLSSAVIEGFRISCKDIVICMDADFSHPPECIPKLADKVVYGGCDMAFGSRYVKGGTTEEGWGGLRWLNSKVATVMARPFANIHDPMSGFFAMSRATFECSADLNPVGYKIGLELLVKCRCCRVGEIPIHFANRKYGQSKLSLREQLNYLRHIKRLADFKGGYWRLFFR